IYLFRGANDFNEKAWDQTLRVELGIRQHVLNSAELAELEPTLPSIEGRAALFPDAMHVTDPAALMKRLQHKAQHHGATFYRAEVTRLEPQPDGRILLSGSDISVTASWHGRDHWHFRPATPCHSIPSAAITLNSRCRCRPYRARSARSS